MLEKGKCVPDCTKFYDNCSECDEKYDCIACKGDYKLNPAKLCAIEISK